VNAKVVEDAKEDAMASKAPRSEGYEVGDTNGGEVGVYAEVLTEA
jgi:hypothetical protein